MPIYVYRCDTCGLTFERRQRMTEAPLQDCPECEGHVQRVIQPVGIVFKGSGFYVTDNRSKSSTALPGKKESDSDTQKADSAEPGDSKAKAKDKPAESKATSKTD
jgi:putative FmdB family regulatory protein